MRLAIVQVGEPVLRQAGKFLEPAEILSPEVQQLIELMRETMRQAPGVGLAAPQIGLSLQLAVIEDTAESAATERSPVPFHVIANPRLELGPEIVEFYEGCLSVEGYQAIVPRARSVRVHALNHKARADRHRRVRLVRAHPAARDRSSGRNAVHRQDAKPNPRDRAQLLPLLGRRTDRRGAGDPRKEDRDDEREEERALMSAWALFWLLAQAAAAPAPAAPPPPPPPRVVPLPARRVARFGCSAHVRTRPARGRRPRQPEHRRPTPSASTWRFPRTRTCATTWASRTSGRASMA